MNIPMTIGWVAALAIRVSCALEADIETDRGTFTVVLEQEHTPLATANFIRLAGGGTWWRDPATGGLRDRPIYQNAVVDGVVANAAEAFLEFGAADAPGYEFPDEFHPSLGHGAYVVTMATAAPNTNSARIRVFGDRAAATRDGRHTVFGFVAEGPGRAVVDAILAAGPGATGILGVTIRGRETWEETPAAQGVELPEMQPVAAAPAVVPGVSAELLFPQPHHSVFMAHASSDLVDWQPLVRRFLDGDSPGESSVFLDAAGLPRRFYHPSLAVYPGDPPGVAMLAETTLEISGATFGIMRYHFDASGMGGTYENIVSLEPPPLVFSGNFTVVGADGPQAMPHSLQLLVSTPGLGGAEIQMIRIGWDGAGAGGPHGRHVTRFLDASMNGIFDGEGTAGLLHP